MRGYFLLLHGYVPVIGIAKSHFARTLAEAEVLRGKSKRPLLCDEPR